MYNFGPNFLKLPPPPFFDIYSILNFQQKHQLWTVSVHEIITLIVFKLHCTIFNIVLSLEKCNFSSLSAIIEGEKI